MQDFSVEVVHQMFGGRNKIALLGAALNFGVIFQNVARKYIMYEKCLRKILEKANFLWTIFIFLHAGGEK